MRQHRSHGLKEMLPAGVLSIAITADFLATPEKRNKSGIDQILASACSWQPPFCKQNLLLVQPNWQPRTYFFNHYNVLF